MERVAAAAWSLLFLFWLRTHHTFFCSAGARCENKKISRECRKSQENVKHTHTLISLIFGIFDGNFVFRLTPFMQKLHMGAKQWNRWGRESRWYKKKIYIYRNGRSEWSSCWIYYEYDRLQNKARKKKRRTERNKSFLIIITINRTK